MLDVLGGRDSGSFLHFVDIVTALYLAIRRHHVLFTGLAMTALGSRMPQLTQVEDVYYLRDALVPQLETAEASIFFRAKIDEALNCTLVQVNDAVHNLVAAIKK